MEREAVQQSIHETVVREMLRVVRDAAAAPGCAARRSRDVALELYRLGDRVARTHPRMARRITLTARQLAAGAAASSEVSVSLPAPASHRTIPSAPQSLPEELLVSLPPRYARVLRHLLSGGSEKEIARELGLSRHTIHEYVKAIYRHLGVGSRAQLAAVAATSFAAELLS